MEMEIDGGTHLGFYQMSYLKVSGPHGHWVLKRNHALGKECSSKLKVRVVPLLVFSLGPCAELRSVFS